MAARRPLPAQRASDSQRESTAAALRDHYAAGRLDTDELDTRVRLALRARSTEELAGLTLDLPDAGRGLDRNRGTPRRHVTRGGRALRASVKIHAVIFFAVNALIVTVWAITGGGFFWPAFPLLGWGVGLAAHWAPVAAGIGTKPYRPEIEAARSSAAVAELAARERPDLAPAVAADGTVTLLFSDIVDSTALNSRLGDERWLELLREHHRVIRDAIAAAGGFEVKVQGDGFMVAFADPAAAVRCALAIQAALEQRLGDTIAVRIGVHTGAAIREQEDFYGRNVALAARIADSAGAGETLVSDAVVDRLGTSLPGAAGPVRELELKGLGAQRAYPVQ